MGWKLDKHGGVGRYFSKMKKHLQRLLTLNPIEFGHAFVNIFVEGCRISAYHHGHVMSYLIIILLIIILLLSIF